MGRRCAPRQKHRLPSGDQHPGEGAMASRPSRISTTYSWRLSGSSGPRPRIWALGGLVRPVQKYKFLENALMPGRTVTHGGVRTPESAGRPRRPGVKTQGTVECFPRIAVVPVGGGAGAVCLDPMSRCFTIVSPQRRPRSAHRPIACTWLSRYGFGKEPKGGSRGLQNEMPQRMGIEGCHPIQGTVATLPLTGGCAPPVPGVHG